MSLPWTILADDLTGACDTGAGFARRGLAAVALLDASAAFPPADVLVLSTESRYLPEAQAVRAVRQAAQRVRALGGLVYKKINSTLRGHPGPEFAALLESLFSAGEPPRALIAPAFPAQQRVTRGGQVWVAGSRLEETLFGGEAPRGDLRQIFASQRCLPLEVLRGDPSAALARLRQPGLWLADAETEEDLRQLAVLGLASHMPVWCGSAGLARALGQQLAPLASRSRPERPAGPLLVVAGSQHPATVQQLQALQSLGVGLLSLRAEHLDAPPPAELAWRAAQQLAAGQAVALCARDLPPAAPDQTVARTLAALTAEVLRSFRPIGLLALTGGDTAAAVCAVLGCTQLRLVDEAQPGLALGQMLDGRAAGLNVVTKAGGFGDANALVALLPSR